MCDHQIYSILRSRWRIYSILNLCLPWKMVTLKQETIFKFYKFVIQWQRNEFSSPKRYLELWLLQPVAVKERLFSAGGRRKLSDGALDSHLIETLCVACGILGLWHSPKNPQNVKGFFLPPPLSLLLSLSSLPQFFSYVCRGFLHQPGWRRLTVWGRAREKGSDCNIQSSWLSLE